MNVAKVHVVNSEYQPINDAQVSATSEAGQRVELQAREGCWEGRVPPVDHLILHVSAAGYETERHTITLHSKITQSVVGLRRSGQLSYCYGNDRLAFSPVDDAFLIRVRGSNASKIFAKLAKKQHLEWQPVSVKPANSPDDLYVKISGDLGQVRELSRELIHGNLQVELSRVIAHGDRPALGLNGELVVRFRPEVKRLEAERLAASVGMKISRELRHAGNAFVLLLEGEPTYDLLKAAEALSQSGRAIYVEPNLTSVAESDAYTPDDPLFEQVPHLQLIDADDAWDLLDDVSVDLRGGSPNITIGIVDIDGVAPDHPDLTAYLTDRTRKLITSKNFATRPVTDQTVATLGGFHGTQCAATATAAFDDHRGIPGVAPNCHLIGVRVGDPYDAVLLADICLWVGGFMNGSITDGFPVAPPSRPADVISIAWGPDGLALSNTIRDCFDFLATYGRGGKGTILCFSIGDNGYLDFTDPVGGAFRAWPTYEKTIGVGASISVNPPNPLSRSFHADPAGDTTDLATAVDTRALYNPYGDTTLRKPDLVAPSNVAYDIYHRLVDPILSATRVGLGAVNGCLRGPACNDYDFTFGGTSHATATVAGAVALILSARPDLNWVQVREILRQTCVRIDDAQPNPTGQWRDLDGDGHIDFSRWYGAGRLDVDEAIATALDPSLALADIYVRDYLDDTGAVPSSEAWWHSPDIWVQRDAMMLIPELDWTEPAPHEDPRRGHDNAVFCRIRNRGAATAPVTYVRAMLTHWAGLDFVYPDDFEPSTNVGAAIPDPLVPGTYLIGETRLDNLAPGASQIVKFIWPEALIPPESVVVRGATVLWHPCLLVEAAPHDGPTLSGDLAVSVQGDNNIAQRNIAIQNTGDEEAGMFVGMIMGTRQKGGVATLIIDASQLGGENLIFLHIADEAAMKHLTHKALQGINEPFVPIRYVENAGRCAVIIEQSTRLRVECGQSDVVIEAAPGTRIFTGGCMPGQPFSIREMKHHGLNVLEIRGLRGYLELPLHLDEGKFVPLLVAVSGQGTGDLHITQRRGHGELSSGYGIRRIST